LQCWWASSSVIVPRPWVFVRQTLDEPANIVFVTTGSEMIGE
jgi:hypothetical protein